MFLPSRSPTRRNTDANRLTKDAHCDRHRLGAGRRDGDEGQLRQVLANLMRNALVHTPQGTPIEVSVASRNGDATLTVRDHGPGLPTENPSELFDRFWRADPSRGPGRAGAGLGLAIVAGVVAAHGGGAAATDAEGGGALRDRAAAVARPALTGASGSDTPSRVAPGVHVVPRRFALLLCGLIALASSPLASRSATRERSLRRRLDALLHAALSGQARRGACDQGPALAEGPSTPLCVPVDLPETQPLGGASMLAPRMRIFSFDAARCREQYAAQGWIHIRGGVDPEFLAYLQDFARAQFASHHVEGLGIGGSKSQAIFEFATEVDFPGELFDVVAAVAGCRREGMTLSERHIKIYDADAPADPRPHKDRLSSLVSVGLSIDVPQGSHLELYPGDDVWVNPLNVAGSLLGMLPEERQPEVTLAGKQPVRIDDAAGDVVMFPGSAVWHRRCSAANVKNLYLKFNDFGSDPLGEDPRTGELRARTLASLENGGLGSLTAVPARRFDVIRRLTTRMAEVKVLEADVWGAPSVALSNEEAAILENLDRGRAVAELDERSVRRLARAGVIDLI